MLTFIDVKFISNLLFLNKFWDKGLSSYANILQIADAIHWVLFLILFPMFLANSLPMSSLQDKWNVLSFSTHYQKSSITSSQVFSITLYISSSYYAVELMSFFTYGKPLPNWFC